ncbi:MAG: hypothetical protein IT454_02055 [Planctomycetes bacterium]|nr:hypothetical protein [Planctomycetota bacterium]
MTSADALTRFGAALTGVMNALDWEQLGSVYCEGDAAEFFDAERRQSLIDTGLELADGIAGQLYGRSTERSLYVGAAVAELAPILAERLVLGREVTWLNLPGAERDELARALREVSAQLGIDLPAPSVAPLESVVPASCDHVWLVSVLTDPDTFPALHDELYERRGTEHATGRGNLVDERARATELAQAVLARAARSCLLSTTEEELDFMRPLLAPARRRVRPLAEGPLTALVGDRVLWLRLTQRDAR